MQAYASAASIPRASEFRLAPVSTVVQNLTLDVRDDVPVAGEGAVVLASLILDGLGERGLAVLARRLLPHLTQPSSQTAPSRHVYTVASLAADLGVSPKTIRCAIARGELSAVKRGSRWIISANAVRAWATEPDRRRRTRCSFDPTAPAAAGPSLRSALRRCASGGGER